MSYPTILTTPGMASFAKKVDEERQSQLKFWGDQHYPTGTGGEGDKVLASLSREACQVAEDQGRVTWRHILIEEVHEAMAESDPDKIVEELIQVAAVCQAIIADLQR